MKWYDGIAVKHPIPKPQRRSHVQMQEHVLPDMPSMSQILGAEELGPMGLLLDETLTLRKGHGISFYTLSDVVVLEWW